MPLPEPRAVTFGDSAVLVEVAGPEEAQQLDAALRRASLPWVRGTVPALSSVLVEYDPLRVERAEVHDAIATAARADRVASAAGRSRTIPVVYGGEHGPDLPEVARLLGRPADEVVRLHGTSTLRVLFDGFAPGFAYLGDLPPELHVERLATPRVRTPSGSVAIAGPMTGIYPAELPGGWRVIGRTPIALFDPLRDPPAYLVPGDSVRVERITADEWERYAGPQADW